MSSLYCFAEASSFDITASICSRAPCAPAMESFFDHSYAFIAHTIAELPASIAWSLFRGVILPLYTSVAFCVTFCVTLLKNVGSLGKSFSFALHELSISASSHVSNSFNLASICAIDSALRIVSIDPASNNAEYKYCNLPGIKIEFDASILFKSCFNLPNISARFSRSVIFNNKSNILTNDGCI